MVAWILLLIAQGVATIVLLKHLAPGWSRRPPVEPMLSSAPATASVSVLLATLNEAKRVGRCLAGLMAQGAPLKEILVVDSGSLDGTGEIVRTAATRDPRIKLLQDPPLPPGWVGKVWALEFGLQHATGEWVLGVDADTEPKTGMVAAIVARAEADGLDVVSFGPRFAGMTAAEQWLQPSMLLTLVYRHGAVGGASRPHPDRVMANGQCFLARREVLLNNGGYAAARNSWADDVTLARTLAAKGYAVDFMDGSRLYDVRAYDGLPHMWREWGRSFDLSDATDRVRQWGDVLFIVMVQGLPMLILAAFAAGLPPLNSPAGSLLLTLNAFLFTIRVLMLFAIKGSYAVRSVGYWLSPLSDPVAAFRLLLSSVRRPTQWRGRAPLLTEH